MRVAFGIRRHALDTLVPPVSMAVLHPPVDDPPDILPPPTYDYRADDDWHPWRPWNGTWTPRPSTLPDEIAAAHQAHLGHVLALPDGGGVIGRPVEAPYVVATLRNALGRRT